MAAFLSVLPFIASHPDGITRRDKAEVRNAVGKLSYRWTVSERKDRGPSKGRAHRYLVAELRSAIDMPAFRLHRHEGAVVLSEIDDTGTWLLGQFASMADALAKLRQAAMARFAGSGSLSGPEHVATA